MPDEFRYDVFLSHSVKDKPIVRELAERLRKDGLRVWLDEWALKPGDHVQAKIEEGLEQSRVLVLCMSANAFGSDWAQLEAGTFRFRDPMNRERRFIPLRLDAAPIKGSLAQFLYINWLPEEREQEYAKLLEACRPSAEPPIVEVKATKTERTITFGGEYLVEAIRLDLNITFGVYAFSPDGKFVLSAPGRVTRKSSHNLRLWDVKTGRCLHVFDGHEDTITSIEWSANQQYALSGSRDDTLRMWDVKTGKCLRILKSQSRGITSIALGSDQWRVISGSWDGNIKLWNTFTSKLVKVFDGHNGCVTSVAWSADQRCLLSGSWDMTLRLWEVETGQCVRVFKGHTGYIKSVALSADQRFALSGAEDKTLRMWDVETGQCLRVLEGHKGDVLSIAWSADGRFAFSAADNSVRLWDLEKGRSLHVFNGHEAWVRNVTWGANQRYAISGDEIGCVCVWDLAGFGPELSLNVSSQVWLDELVGISSEITKISSSGNKPEVPDQVQYTNAKVLLVGDSGVGKTGLSNYLALGIKDEERNTSTDGAWATHWPLKHAANKDGVEREIWLWDFAGQVDYRLVHQLFMDDTAAAVLVFNPQNENPFEGLGQWDRDMQKAARKPFAKLLAAGRIDRGGLVVSDAGLTKFIGERGFRSSLHLTSAKTGEGCDALRDAIIAAIDWQNIPETTSPALYHRLKQEILHLRDSGLVLIRLAELKQRMEMALLGERFELAELQTVVGLLAGPGMIQRVDFGGFILLRPEVISRYAAAVVRRVRKHPQELGCIREDELLDGELDYQDFERLPLDDEKVILRALLETFVSRAWCLRQPCDGSALLTFPSYFRRERKEQPGHPNVLVTYRFSGHVEDLYATLVVRLHHTEAFEAGALWKDAADFKTQTGQSLGLKLVREAEGAARLEVYFNPDVDENSRLVFLRYVHNHLTEHAQDVVRLRHYCCGNRKCDDYNQPFTDQARIDRALAGGKDRIFCPACSKAILLRDVMEQKFDSPAVKEQARKMQVESQIVIDNESRELILVGHAFTITAEAGQIYRGYTNSDHGIDGEIEFKDNDGRATGKRLYLQLKSGDSYLTTRKRDGAEVFQIKNERWAQYWREQAYPVLLVIRTSDGEIRWMDVSEYLRKAGQPVKQIVFSGERFDVMSVRRRRDRALRSGMMS